VEFIANLIKRFKLLDVASPADAPDIARLRELVDPIVFDDGDAILAAIERADGLDARLIVSDLKALAVPAVKKHNCPTCQRVCEAIGAQITDWRDGIEAQIDGADVKASAAIGTNLNLLYVRRDGGRRRGTGRSYGDIGNVNQVWRKRGYFGVRGVWRTEDTETDGHVMRILALGDVFTHDPDAGPQDKAFYIGRWVETRKAAMHVLKGLVKGIDMTPYTSDYPSPTGKVDSPPGIDNVRGTGVVPNDDGDMDAVAGFDPETGIVTDK